MANAEVAATVTIPQSEYDKLIEDSVFLNCLRNAGVDNWDGYEIAQDEFQEYQDQ